ncbi:MAG: hypothetical protein HY074_06470 [Deltaproteobacteria bacterium]|nr:hypothetical protein [Deltaproteobacteria bacterium]
MASLQPTNVKRKVFSVLVILGISTAAALIAGEWYCRAKGLLPYSSHEISIRVEPGGSFIGPHPILGYANLPGAFRITHPTGYTWKGVQDGEGHRVTRPQAGSTKGHKDELWIFGCSLTYGWTLNDSETFPWLLQERFPAYDVTNFGVAGYGTLHSLLQLRGALATGRRPKAVVLGFMAGHISRNTFSRTRRKMVKPYSDAWGSMIQPFAKRDSSGNLRVEMAKYVYEGLPFVTESALMNFLDDKLNEWDEDRPEHWQVTKGILDEIASTCEQRGIPLVLADLSPFSDRFSKEWAANHPLVTLAWMGVNFQDPVFNNQKLAHDGHPNAAANRLYSQKLGSALTQVLATRRR